MAGQTTDKKQEQYLADFHLHTKHSFDGVLTPEEIIRSAKKNNVRWLALTDHNNLQACIDLWNKHGQKLKNPVIEVDGVNVIAGVEVTCKVMPVANLKGNASKVHLLIYGADLSPDSPIVRLMALKHQNDLDYDLRRLNYLLSLKPNVHISLEEIQAWCTKNCVEGEPSNKQIMDFLDEKGIDLGITSEKKLTRLLEDMPQIERLDLDAEKVIQVAHASRGKVVLAHPSQNLRRTTNKMDLLRVLLRAGLDGFELLYNGANPNTAQLISDAIRNHDKKKAKSVLYTGGSDTHSFAEGNTIGKWNKHRPILESTQENGLIKAANEMHKAFKRGERASLPIDVAVGRYLVECENRLKGIQVEYEKPKKKPKKPKHKKNYHSKPSPEDYFYAAASDSGASIEDEYEDYEM